MSGFVDCPECAATGRDAAVEDLEVLERAFEAESLDSFVDGRGETVTVEEIAGWRLVPCGHEYPVSEWVVLIDEGGPRLYKRARVLLIADNGEVAPA